MAYAGLTQWRAWEQAGRDAGMTALEARQYADMCYAEERGRPFGDSAPPGTPVPPTAAPEMPKALSTKPFPHAKPRASKT